MNLVQRYPFCLCCNIFEPLTTCLVTIKLGNPCGMKEV